MQYGGEERRWSFCDVPELDSRGLKTRGRVKGSLKSNVEYLDHLLSRIIRALDDLGIRDNTILMFCGDNGTPGYGKNKLETEVGPHVPFVVSCRGLVKKAGASDILIDFSDVLPTLIELARWALPRNYQIDGRSFAPLLLGRTFTPREWIFCQLHEARWVRDRRWLLDGYGRFWDCGDSREEWKGYSDVTLSEDPEAIAARKRFEEISKPFPTPDLNHPETAARWRTFFTTHKRLSVYRPPYL